jgi:NADH-quinone oxidoreductase subunit H
MNFGDCLNNLSDCLVQSGAARGLADFISNLLGVVLVATVPLVTVIMLIWIERKFAARVQDRLGPNRVGPFGLLQTIADAVKMLTKEDITPVGADRFIYNLAPIIAFAAVILMWAVVPFTSQHIGADLSIGALYFVAIGSIGTVKIMIAGWSSNNKYALLGAFRTIAQLLSYEVPFVMSLLIPVMLAGTMSMQGIVHGQIGMWYVFMAPIAFAIFFIANLAETGRAPFDLLEAESEIIAGYNIEYSGFKWGIFMASEFLHAFTAALFTAVLFLGGWSGPLAEQIPILGFVYLGLKTAVVYLFALLIRSTVPRVRIDQMMAFNWKFLVPLSIGVVLVTAFLLKVVQSLGLAPAPDRATDLVANIPQTIVLLLGNVAIILLVGVWLRSRGAREKAADMKAAARHQADSMARAGAPAGD